MQEIYISMQEDTIYYYGGTHFIMQEIQGNLSKSKTGLNSDLL